MGQNTVNQVISLLAPRVTKLRSRVPHSAAPSPRSQVNRWSNLQRAAPQGAMAVLQRGFLCSPGNFFPLDSGLNPFLSPSPCTEMVLFNFRRQNHHSQTSHHVRVCHLFYQEKKKKVITSISSIISFKSSSHFSPLNQGGIGQTLSTVSRPHQLISITFWFSMIQSSHSVFSQEPCASALHASHERHTMIIMALCLKSLPLGSVSPECGESLPLLIRVVTKGGH